jgi:multisubunit Na+/H+ antiporter MnhG subunit
MPFELTLTASILAMIVSSVLILGSVRQPDVLELLQSLSIAVPLGFASALALGLVIYFSVWSWQDAEHKRELDNFISRRTVLALFVGGELATAAFYKYLKSRAEELERSRPRPREVPQPRPDTPPSEIPPVVNEVPEKIPAPRVTPRRAPPAPASPDLPPVQNQQRRDFLRGIIPTGLLGTVISLPAGEPPRRPIIRTAA